MTDGRSRWRAWLDEFGTVLIALAFWLFMLYQAVCGVARE